MNRPKASMIKKPAPEVVQPPSNEDSKPEKTRVLLGLYVLKAAKHQLAIMAATDGRTQQDFLAEALNDLFQKYGKGRIA